MPFTWKPLYRELARALVGWESRQAELLLFLSQLDREGLTVLPLEDRGEGGRTFPLAEIDPFTFFAAFNRNTTLKNRLAIIDRCRAFFRLESATPTDLRGIPTANNQNSWFFAYADTRDRGDVPALWSLATSAVTGGLAAVSQQQFDRCLEIKQVKLPKLTQGLFWLRHDEFLPLDGSTRSALEKHGMRVDVSDFASYRTLVESVRVQIGEDFVALSASAYHGDGEGPAADDKPRADARGHIAVRLKAWLADPKTGVDIATRERAESEAREILNARIGQLTEADLRAVLKLLNTCEGGSGTVYTRFSPQFAGHNANSVVSALDRVNPLVEALWKANTTEAIRGALDRFLDARIPAAGTSFPTGILYLRDPARFPVWLVNFEAAIRRVLAKETPKGKKNAAGYFEYAELVRELCEQFGVPASLHDKALWLLNSEDLDVPAPGPSSRDQPGERMDPQRLADELAMPVATIKRIAGLANERGQVILNGPPGTGKTEVALCIARMIAGNDDRFKKVQFHPSYGYEEFMEGLRPVLKSGALQYEVVPGVFRTLCESARASPQHRHVLVIDEINRGNLPRIFGELLMLLERRGETVTLPYSKQTFSIPKNLTLIGTMNSADRSIALLDLALRRRFPFVQLAPDDTVLRTWLTRKNLPTEVVGIFQTLNRELERAGVEPERSIGHTYFMKERLDEQELEEIWETQIQPLVVELFFDDRSKAAEFDLDKIRARSMTEAAE